MKPEPVERAKGCAEKLRKLAEEAGAQADDAEAGAGHLAEKLAQQGEAAKTLQDAKA